MVVLRDSSPHTTILLVGVLNYSLFPYYSPCCLFIQPHYEIFNTSQVFLYGGWSNPLRGQYFMDVLVKFIPSNLRQTHKEILFRSKIKIIYGTLCKELIQLIQTLLCA